MTIELFPRLDTFSARELWEEYHSAPNCTLEWGLHHPAVTYTQTGGSKVIESRLRGIRARLVEIARECRFPERASREATRRFDFLAARFLSGEAQIPVCEAMRQDMWAYFSLILAPDISDWRFEGRPRERWTAGIRNTFGILWRRGYLIGVDHKDGLGSGWETLEALTQDALVQIVERTSLTADPRTARVIAESWARTSELRTRQAPMEAVMRSAIRNLRAYRVTQELDALSENTLRERVFAAFQSAVDENTIDPSRPR
ncbi:hypothetical protein [Thioalkalivibrio sp. AKL12]|uniref:hypothetical protein n=1 Tax=Thioalkalivibrio sp. AKL12 TaxID=1158159 RepID=UPI0003789B75|nr:hypothetical protein [Thioalkalivibrio sp. AKL12]